MLPRALTWSSSHDKRGLSGLRVLSVRLVNNHQIYSNYVPTCYMHTDVDEVSSKLV